MEKGTQRFAVTIAVLIAFGARLEAQQRETANPSAPATTTSTLATSSATGPVTVHLEGCVFPKRALTTKEKVTLAADSVEDFVLSDVHVVSVAPGTAVIDKSVFKLDQVDQALLHQLNGLRVGVTGRVDSGQDLRTLRVRSIRETTGDCPTAPTPQP
jgi:hypothetical protein